MKKLLDEYLAQIAPLGKKIDAETGHLIALAMLTFKMGLFTDCIERCSELLGDGKVGGEGRGAELPRPVRKAVEIIRTRARDLMEGRVYSPDLPNFTPEEEGMLPIRIPPAAVDDPQRLSISNALVVLYAVALAASPEDAPALEEQERYVLQLYAPYRKLLEG